MGDTYTVRSRVTLPFGATGSYRLRVAADDQDSVFELGGSANNVGVALAPTVISAAPSAERSPSCIGPDKVLPAAATMRSGSAAGGFRCRCGRSPCSVRWSGSPPA